MEKEELKRIKIELAILENAWRYCDADEIYEKLPSICKAIREGAEWKL